MELNLDLIDRALEYRINGDKIIEEMGGQPRTLVSAIFHDTKGGWVEITDKRAQRSYLFTTLVAVEDITFGDYRVALPKTQWNSLDNYWEIFRFAFSCGYIPVFTANMVYCEYVVVPSENDGVLMAAFVDALDWPRSLRT